MEFVKTVKVNNSSDAYYSKFITKNNNCILYFFSLFIDQKLDKEFITFDYEENKLTILLLNTYNINFSFNILYFLIFDESQHIINDKNILNIICTYTWD